MSRLGSAADLPAVHTFDFGDLHGEVVTRRAPELLEPAIRRLIDPVHAEETIHWGRNYLYRTHLGDGVDAPQVVVKQVRNHGWRNRLRRRFGGSKAARSWHAARAFQAAGIDTAEPIALIESDRADGPSFFVSRHLDGLIEARYVLRAANGGTLEEDFPTLDFDCFLTTLGQTIRRMHDAGLFHRDLSIGNVLLPVEPGDGPMRLPIVDLNRVRFLARMGPSTRTRDLCRLRIFRPAHQRRFLEAYWGEDRVGWFRRTLYLAYQRGFLLKTEGKKTLRARVGSAFAWLRPRRAHAHIPEAPDGAGARDKIVWDALSDQPHQHASRFEKTMLRLADLPSHVRYAAAAGAAGPRIWRRYRTLRHTLHHDSVPFDGIGICVRPHPDDPAALLEAIDDLGVRHVLLRLHPWATRHDEEEALAEALVARGHTLAFSLPQNRDLVRDPDLWQERVATLAERFTPYGKSFQVGQAVNRSKWGIWRYSEYAELARRAGEVLRRYDGVEVLGPAVIDFELHVTAALVNRADTGMRFDALASLLYVDRRGAPENRQLGFDSVSKVLLCQAIADTARGCTGRSWITEVNWPLWEGPHAPAGRSVSVDEATQADYLSRFYVLALATGAAERVYWWQLVARGYGLMAVESDGSLRKRPSFQALRTLTTQLGGSRSRGPEPGQAAGCHVYRFERDDGTTIRAVWSERTSDTWQLPKSVIEVVGQDGRSKTPDGDLLEIGPSVQYVHLGGTRT